MTPILKVFGLQLQNLKFKSCHEIKLTDLALCSQLENLRIRESSLNSREFISSIDAPAFLPRLKRFKSDSCLGLASRLFEEKPTLVSLVLHCSHVGVNQYTDERSRPSRIWNSTVEVSYSFLFLNFAIIMTPFFLIHTGGST